MAYTIEWEGRGFYKRFTGMIAFHEYARSQEEVTSDPHFDDALYIINDLLEVEGYTATKDEAEYAAAYTRGPSLSNPRVRVAYVTADARIILLIKMVRMISSLDLATFPTVEESRTWCLEARN